MSTSCNIGILDKGKVRYINCHWDGELSFTGVVLQLAYTTREKVSALIALGHIGKIGYNVEAPKRFNGAIEATKYYEYCFPHLKTMFTLAKVRDMRTQPFVRQVVVSQSQFCKESLYGYMWDVKQNCWLFTTRGCKPVSLEKLLTDKEFAQDFLKTVKLNEQWKDIDDMYQDYKADLSCKGVRSVIGQYNRWLANQSFGQGLEFGYVTRDGKRVYALFKKAAKPDERRKVITYSPLIGDLVAYLDIHMA